jgi:hypothetical protein
MGTIAEMTFSVFAITGCGSPGGFGRMARYWKDDPH